MHKDVSVSGRIFDASENIHHIWQTQTNDQALDLSFGAWPWFIMNGFDDFIVIYLLCAKYFHEFREFSIIVSVFGKPLINNRFQWKKSFKNSLAWVEREILRSNSIYEPMKLRNSSASTFFRPLRRNWKRLFFIWDSIYRDSVCTHGL